MKPGSWLQHKERSNRSMMRLIAWITLKMSRKFSYLLLYPICFYYLLFSPRSVKSSKLFLQKVLPSKVKWRHCFHHYYVFASTLIDRVHFLKGSDAKYNITIEGIADFQKVLSQHTGCLLLSAHFGTFDLLRLLASEHDIPVKALMYQNNAETMRYMTKYLNPSLSDMVIEIGQPNTLLQVKDALEAGYCVGLLGDRYTQGERTVSCDFLSQPANFPSGPVLLASILKVPVVMLFGFQRKRSDYQVIFEVLSTHIELPREDRNREVQVWTQKFADRLAYYAKQYPYNWFNYYDFWQQNLENNKDES